MAKKRKRKKRPAPPPRPGQTIEQITSGRHPEVAAPAPSGEAPAPAPVSTTQERRQAAVQRRQAARRRQRTRNIAIAVVVVVAIVGVFVFRQVQNSRRIGTHDTLAARAGCEPVRTTGGLGRDHWAQGQPIPTYETSPPSGGSHAASTVPANFYGEPFSEDINETPSIFQAVHSLEHGYIIVWTGEMSADERGELERELRPDARKLIVAPYPDMPEGKSMALSAWGRLQVCDEADPDVALSFIDLYREKTAPEATAP